MQPQANPLAADENDDPREIAEMVLGSPVGADQEHLRTSRGATEFLQQSNFYSATPREVSSGARGPDIRDAKSIPNIFPDKPLIYFEAERVGDRRGRRLFMSTKYRDGKLERDILWDVMVKPDGNLFHLPINDAEMGRSIINRRESTADGDLYNLYEMKGYRYATVKDWLALGERNKQNRADQANALAHRDPLKMQEMIAKIQAKATGQAIRDLIGVDGGVDIEAAYGRKSAEATADQVELVTKILEARGVIPKMEVVAQAVTPVVVAPAAEAKPGDNKPKGDAAKKPGGAS